MYTLLLLFQLLLSFKIISLKLAFLHPLGGKKNQLQPVLSEMLLILKTSCLEENNFNGADQIFCF